MSVYNLKHEEEYHDEIHEALHRDARVDYTKPILRNGDFDNILRSYFDTD